MRLRAVARSCRLACDHYKAVLHGTVEFQSPCSPDLFFFWNELSVQLHQVLQSPRVHRTWTNDRWMIKEINQCLGPQAKGLRCPNAFFSSRRDIADHIVPMHVINTHLTHHGTLHRHRQHHRHRHTCFPEILHPPSRGYDFLYFWALLDRFQK